MKFEVRRATPNDLTSASDVLRAAARHLAERGEPLWQPDAFDPERLAPFVASNELHVTVQGGEVVGAFLLQSEDDVFWPSASPGEAFYVHKLATRPDREGRGVATAALTFAREEARAEGRRFVRLDCAPRPKLCAFYEAFGFRRVDPKPWRVGDFETVRYELRVAE